MSFTQLERIVAAAKSLQGGVMDSDGTVQWYESTRPFGFVLDAAMVWTQASALRASPAANVTVARGNCAGPLLGILDDYSLPADAIRLTPVPGVNNTYVTLATYGDFSTWMFGWLKPTFVPQAGGIPSNGYAIRLYNGDPAGAGVEVLTTDGATGTGINKSVGWVFNYDNGLLLLSDLFNPTITDPYIVGFHYIGTVAGGGGLPTAVDVKDEGLLVQAGATVLNFLGADVLAFKDGGIPGQVNIYVPAPAFLSHWNTADGSNGSQAVTESITRATAHISTPSGGEGTPFRTNLWSTTNQSASLNGTVTITTPGDTSGFGGTSTIKVEVFDADGASLLEAAYTTPPITGNAVDTSLSTNIVVTTTNYGADVFRFKAHVSVAVNIAAIFTAALLTGGRYHIRVTHTTDVATDNSGPYVYTQSDVFYDTNPTTPEINGLTTIAETGGSVVTKHLSGVEYYILTSAFTVGVVDIDDFNENTSRVSSNLMIVGTEYGLLALNHSPLPAGTGNAFFTGWTNDHDQDNVNYSYTAWAISTASYRYIGPTCNITAQAQDTWAAGTLRASADALILIDTYTDNSTALFEDFNGEAQREDHASFPGAGTWVSTAVLAAGEAQVFNSRIMVPSSTTYVRSDGASTPNADWTLYKPNAGGANPDYSAAVPPSSYGRRFTKAPGANIPSFNIVFTGTFAAGNALADLVAGNLEIYVYRIAGLGHTGPPPANIWPLRIHEPFSFALWDDGATVAGSGLREGSSVGNTINCTFGTGTPADTGFYCWVRIINAATSIDSMTVTFF
jgi:hypothetical protein